MQWKNHLLALGFLMGASRSSFGQRFTPVDFPGAAGTTSWTINSRGDIAGDYVSADRVSHAFVRNGTHFTRIDYPGAALTLGSKINSRGDIVGEYSLTATGPHRGYLQDREGGFQSILYPGATSTAAIGINNRGDIVGTYSLADNVTHSFLLSVGHYSTIDYPGASATVANGITNSGDIYGGYTIAGVGRGFVRTGDKFRTVDYPGAAFTNIVDINASGEIVGRYRDAAARSHGYILTSGKFTVVDYPGSTFTGLTGINAAGNIVGRTTVATVNHGFVYLRQEHQRPSYTITDLGSTGAAPGQAYSIADNGLTAGAVIGRDKTSHATLWYGPFKSDLNSSLGGQNSLAYSVSENGWVVGIAENATTDINGEDFCGFRSFGLTTRGVTCSPFAWHNGVATKLPLLGGFNGQASWVNNRGEVVGMAETARRDPKCTPPQVLQFRPTLWIDGKVRELPVIGNDQNGLAFANNDLGQVVGSSGDCAPFNSVLGAFYQPVHAILWENGVARDLGNLGGTGHGAGNNAVNLNHRGDVVGFSDVAGDVANRGYIWSKRTGMRDLGTMPGDVNSAALSINDRGEVVGVSLDTQFNPRAGVWRDGVMLDLNQLVPTGNSLYLLAALSINARGEIAGLAVDPQTGEPHAYIATPNDAPVARRSNAARPEVPEAVRRLVYQSVYGAGRLRTR